MINVIKAAFVTATKEIIRENGLEAASIRRISERAGYSSGTLYLYFDGIDELVTMALVANMNGYISELLETDNDKESAETRYRRVWTLFCLHGFKHPAEYLELFYGPKSANMGSIARKYYELFPDELEHASGLILDMLEKGNLLERNRTILEPYGTELGLSEEEISLANELTISFFHTFLLKAVAAQPNEEDIKAQTEHFLEGAFFALKK